MLLCACGVSLPEAVGTPAAVSVSVPSVSALPGGSTSAGETLTSSNQGSLPGGTSAAVTQPGNQPTADVVRVTKCFTNATKRGGGEMLIKADSSDRTAHLFAYRPDGTLIGEVQNGGGGRYGGTVMPYQPYDPATVTVRSSAGGSVTVPTAPFQAEN